MGIEIDKNPHSDNSIDAEITFGGLGDRWGSTSIEIKDGEIVLGDGYDEFSPDEKESMISHFKYEFRNHCLDELEKMAEVYKLLGISFTWNFNKPVVSECEYKNWEEE